MKAIERTFLLWTGGWDSTYRLLVLLDGGQTVRPVYLLNPKRRSTAAELATMAALRDAILQRRPDWSERLEPLWTQRVEEIPPNDDLTACFQRLLTRSHLGEQYEWLARFAEAFHPDPLELGIHRDDKAHAFLEDAVIREGAGLQNTTVLAPEHAAGDLRLFRRFRFPLFDVTKLEMSRIAAAKGWAEWMEQTWFCHDPQPDGRACGRCPGCVYTREEGLAHRVPALSLAQRLWRTLSGRIPWPIKRRLKAFRARFRTRVIA